MLISDDELAAYNKLKKEANGRDCLLGAIRASWINHKIKYRACIDVGDDLVYGGVSSDCWKPMDAVNECIEAFRTYISMKEERKEKLNAE